MAHVYMTGNPLHPLHVRETCQEVLDSLKQRPDYLRLTEHTYERDRQVWVNVRFIERVYGGQ